jgi:hypothetical protein
MHLSWWATSDTIAAYATGVLVMAFGRIGRRVVLDAPGWIVGLHARAELPAEQSVAPEQ